MRVVTPMLTQIPGTVRVPALATLEQGGGLVDAMNKPGSPPGYTDWSSIITSTQQKIASEPTQAGKAVLSSALSVAAAAAPIPVAGWIVAAAGTALTLFGITIRGKTQHVDAPTSGAKAVAFVTSSILPIWLNIPTDARLYLWQQTVRFDQYMWDTFSYWWGGAMQRDRVPLNIFPVEFYTSMSDAQMRDYLSGGFNIFAFYFYEIMHNADADSVNDNMKTWYFDPLQKYVLRPLDVYMLDKYNTSISQYVQAGGSQAITPVPKKFTTAQAAIGIGAGVLALGAVLGARKKGAAR